MEKEKEKEAEEKGNRDSEEKKEEEEEVEEEEEEEEEEEKEGRESYRRIEERLHPRSPPWAPWEEDLERHPLDNSYDTFFSFEYTCTIKRNPKLCLLGYIDIPQKEKIFEGRKRAEKAEDLLHRYSYLHSLFGEVTYCAPVEREETRYFRVGFDCAHTADIIPYCVIHLNSPILPYQRYKDYAHVKKALKNTAQKLYEIETHLPKGWYKSPN